MSDFGVLSEIRKILLGDEKVAQLTKMIHITEPPVRNYPAITIELEEIINFLQRGQGAPIGNVKLKITCISQKQGPVHALTMAKQVANCLDGRDFYVSDKNLGSAKLVGTVMHIPKDERARFAYNYFEVLIRG